jgi:uncharacterized phage protein gp47/JayE
MTGPLVPIDYTSKDYEGFRQSMLDYAVLLFPEWTGRSAADFGVTLVELFAYMGDILSYYGDRVAREAFITTATQRSSLLSHANLLGYSPFGWIAATGTVTFQTTLDQLTAMVIPAHTQVATDFVASIDGVITYETDASVTVPSAGGSIITTVTQGITQGNLAKTLNAGTSTQAAIMVVQLGTSDGSMDQTYQIPDAPIIDGSVRIFVDDTLSIDPTAVVEWARTTSLLSTGPTDYSFYVFLDDTNTTYVTFGDGINSMIPLVGVRIYAIYRVGGGIIGNIENNRALNYVPGTVGMTVSAASQMVGGSDPESNDSIRTNAPKAFRTQSRAVTLQDFKDLALTVPGVTKSAAVAGSTTSITVFIVGPFGTVPSAALLAQTSTLLSSEALFGVSIAVVAGTKMLINIGTTATPVRVGVYKHFNTADVQVQAELAVSNLLDVSGTTMGQRVGVSSIYTAVASIPGVAYVIIPMMARSTDPQTGINDVQCRDWEFPSLNTLNLSTEATG